MSEKEAADLAKLIYESGLLKVVIFLVTSHFIVDIISKLVQARRVHQYKKERVDNQEALQKSICLFSTERNSDIRDIRDAVMRMAHVMEKNGQVRKKH